MNRKNGCLIIHGFGGSIEEVIPLARSLKEEGYVVVCPTLAGHTGKRQDLKGIKYQDWILSAEKELEVLLAACENVYLIGFSMGGLIALTIASKYKVAGVVTLNSPIYYWDIKRIVLNIVGDIRKRKLENIRHYLRSSCSFPLSALLNFRMLLSKTKSQIKEVQCPVFVAQALEDDTVRKNSARYIYCNIASNKKFIRYYENSGHLILWSKVSAEVIQDVRSFMRGLENSSFNRI